MRVLGIYKDTGPEGRQYGSGKETTRDPMSISIRHNRIVNPKGRFQSGKTKRPRKNQKRSKGSFRFWDFSIVRSSNLGVPKIVTEGEFMTSIVLRSLFYRTPVRDLIESKPYENLGHTLEDVSLETPYKESDTNELQSKIFFY